VSVGVKVSVGEYVGKSDSCWVGSAVGIAVGLVVGSTSFRTELGGESHVGSFGVQENG